MGRKNVRKGKFAKPSNENVEALDFDIDEKFNENSINQEVEQEEKILFDKRDRGLKNYDDVSVLPEDAHIHENEDPRVEAELAMVANKKIKSQLGDSDFGLEALPVPAPKNETNLSETLEAIQRDFSVLSTKEKRSALLKDSPELIALLEDYKKYIEEVTKISSPLHDYLHNRKVPSSTQERNLLAFLETKAQLLLSYCLHVSFYLLLKTEGKQVANHPVIDRLIELRTYIEKLWPLEQKLQYSLNKMLNSKSGAVGTEILQPKSFRPIETDSGVYKPTGMVLEEEEKKKRRAAARVLREEEELRMAEEQSMTRIQKKKAAPIDEKYLLHVADDGYREDDDQYLSRIINSDAGTLQERLKALRKKPQKAEDLQSEESEEELNGSDDNSEVNDEAYNRLVAENKEITKKRKREEDDSAYTWEKDIARRKIDQRIASHRGLTKIRPKDKKTPRASHRAKYAKTLAKAKSQSKSYKPEPAEGFDGVIGLKTNVIHSTRL